MKATWSDIELALVQGTLEEKSEEELEAFSRVEPPTSQNPAFHVRFRHAMERIWRRLDQIPADKARTERSNGNRKKRVTIPKIVEKRVFQEAGSKCVFCPESDVASLQIHHIDSDPANNVFENLILMCANCHTKATAGVISEDAIRQKKQSFSAGSKHAPAGISSLEGIVIQQPKFIPRRLSFRRP